MLYEILTPIEWAILAFFTLLIGIDKAGLRGTNIVTIPAFAAYFSGKVSVSIVLVLFLVGDFCAIVIYRNKISWKHLVRLLPPALAGIIVGMLVGNALSDSLFRFVMGVLVLICLVLMILKELGKIGIRIPDHWVLHGLFGSMGGFSSMVGNAAGPIMSFYLLSMNLSKDIFIGTGTLFFLVINMIKLPVHVFVWHSVFMDSLIIDLILCPFVFVGVFVGLKIVKRIPERPFRFLIIGSTFLATVKLFM